MKKYKQQTIIIMGLVLLCFSRFVAAQAQDNSTAIKLFLPVIMGGQGEQVNSVQPGAPHPALIDPALTAQLAVHDEQEALPVILWLHVSEAQAALFNPTADAGTEQAAAHEAMTAAQPDAETARRQQAAEATLAQLDAQRAAAVALVTAPVLERLQALGYAATANPHAPMLYASLTPQQINDVATWGAVKQVTLDQISQPEAATAAPTTTAQVTAAAVVERAKGWVWADQAATSGCYTPASNYQYNASGGANLVCRNGAVGSGQYRVEFSGLGTSTGTVQVTAYGGSHHCKVRNWGPAGTTEEVYVRCFSANGAPTDGRFSVLFYKENRNSTLWEAAYLWADQPTAASYTPPLAYQWNSKGGSNTIRRISQGHYEVQLSGINRLGGTVLVTAYGNGAERCKVGVWVPSSSDTFIDVFCFNGTQPVDTRYTLAYMKDSALGVQFAEEQHFGAYVWADQATAAACYTPNTLYQAHTSNATSTACRLATGSYRVRLPTLAALNRTTTQVTAYGNSSDYCTVERWVSDGSGGTNVFVRCFDGAGNAVNTQFTLLYLTDDPINAGSRTTYMADCRAQNVPIPPDWAETGTPWVLQGTLSQNLLDPGGYAAVWSYSDPSARGACIALPRGTGDPGSLAGIICQSATTGAACFWDNKLRSDPNQTPLGWRNQKLVMADLHDGTTLQENCTSCHRGNNVYLISPDDPTWAKLLRGPLSGPSTGTFTTRVESSSDNQDGHPRYIPLARSGWQNPFAAGGCAGACHEMPVISTWPPMPPACAQPSTTDPSLCYGTP